MLNIAKYYKLFSAVQGIGNATLATYSHIWNKFFASLLKFSISCYSKYMVDPEKYGPAKAAIMEAWEAIKYAKDEIQKVAPDFKPEFDGFLASMGTMPKELKGLFDPAAEEFKNATEEFSGKPKAQEQETEEQTLDPTEEMMNLERRIEEIRHDITVKEHLIDKGVSNISVERLQELRFELQDLENKKSKAVG